jgi:Zn-finger protein
LIYNNNHSTFCSFTYCGYLSCATGTLGFVQVGQDIVTLAFCKSQLWFQQTDNYQLLYLTSLTHFQSAAVIGRRNANTQPA